METPHDHKEELPSAFQEHLGTVAEFYARHNEELPPIQKAVEKISFFLGIPGYVAGNLEELRRDIPNVRNRADSEADELSKPTDTDAVLSIIEESADQLNCERK